MALKKRRWSQRIYRGEKIARIMEAYAKKIERSGTESVKWREHLRGVIYPASRLRCRLGPDRLGCLGIDCCAVCGRKRKLKACVRCKRIYYCSQRCARLDAAAHSWSCKQLQRMPTVDKDELFETASSLGPMILSDAVEIRRSREKLSWTADVLASAPKTLHLSREQFSTISYAFSLAWLCTKLVDRSVLTNTASPLSLLILGASAAEAAVPTRIWADAWRLLGPFATSICLTLLGPELPQHLSKKTEELTVGTLHFTFKYARRDYRPSDAKETQLVICFNPGFNCPDYDWTQFTRLKSHSSVPPLIALFAHTKAELRMDLLVLTSASSSPDDDNDNDHQQLNNTVTVHKNTVPIAAKHQPLFFTKNPFHCPCWRQSGTIANDLYRKHSACLVLSASSVSSFTP